MSDAPNWCPVCLVHHPVVSMVRWCLETKGGDMTSNVWGWGG